jgi:hypothetical protein
MTIEDQVIWECFIMRRDRDLEPLWQQAQAGDPRAGMFFDGLGEWRKKCREAPDKTPQSATLRGRRSRSPLPAPRIRGLTGSY